MGQVLSAITRPIRKFNIENRALRLLEKRKESKEIIDPAPKHPTTVKILSRVREENPELFKRDETKHEQLNENLKKVYVESTDPSSQPSSDKQHLPLTKVPSDLSSEFGVMDIDYPVSEGRATLVTMFSFLGQHRLNPDGVTAASIAQEHKLDAVKVEHILKHFKIFSLYIPDEMMEKKGMRKAVELQLEASKSHPGFIHVPGVPKLAGAAVAGNVQSLNSSDTSGEAQPINSSDSKT